MTPFRTLKLGALVAALGTVNLAGPMAAAQVHVTAARADLADLVLASTTVVRARVTKAKEIKAERAPGLSPGYRRFLVDAEVEGVLAAPGGVPGEIRYLADLPETERGRAPSVRGADVLLFLGPEQRPGEYALAHRKGQQAWSSETESIAKRFLAERSTSTLPTGTLEVTGAFHVPGTVPGESESQIFVRGADGLPASLVVLRRPGQDPRVVIATGDVIDPGAPSPDPQALTTLLFACGLPAALPEDAAQGDHAAVVSDFAAAKDALGGCERRFTDS